MIKLKGEVRLKRLYGEINLVPSSAGGGPLQAKTVYPSHERQIITPDEDYYGLVSVVAEPVPRLPACVASVKMGMPDADVDIVVNLAIGSNVTLPSGIEYYYNHEQLPEIPTDVVRNYPYILIMRNLEATRIYACKEKAYFFVDGETNKIIIPSDYARYSYKEAYNVWACDSSGTATYFNVHGDGNWVVWWSNFDIPNGSADSEEIYFPASEAQAEQPMAATQYYYNGVKLPDIPNGDIATHPYWVVLCWANGTTQAIGSINGLYLNGETTLRDKSGATLKAYKLQNGAWVEDANQSGKYSSWTCVSNGVSVLQWSNQNVPNGSATATDIYFYGTPAVPNPV